MTQEIKQIVSRLLISQIVVVLGLSIAVELGYITEHSVIVSVVHVPQLVAITSLVLCVVARLGRK